MNIECCDGRDYLRELDDNSIDLILTDPPYITSRESGMNSLYKKVHSPDADLKTDEEWEIYKKKNNLIDDSKKEVFKKYGSKYGKKYSVKTDYGDWDRQFTMEDLEEFIKLFYKKLRKGGTCIIFFDLWKITPLKALLETYKFKQIRFIEWIKSNPQPLNSKINYLTNCREMALTAVKGSKPTFNSSYDKGIYTYPLQGGKLRFHPTQKNLGLFMELIKKHSKEKDNVLDPFLGSGTTARACKILERNFYGCEKSQEYYEKILQTME